MQPYLWILISGFAFSWMATLAPLAGRACGWQTVAMVRCAIPLILIVIWAKWDGVKLTLRGSPLLWMRSLAGSCSLVGSFFAFTHLPLTDIYAISNTFPVWVALLSWPMLGQMPTGLVWLSIASSIAGVFVLQGPQLQAGNPASLIVVAVSIFTAVAMMGLNRLKHLDPRAVVVHFSATALAFAIAAYFVFPVEEPREAFDWTHAAELVMVGVMATVGQYFLTRAVTAGDPTKVSVASLSQFVMIFVLDISVLGHTVDVSKLWGIPLILGPTIWLMTRRIKTSALAPVSEATSERLEDDWAICADAAGSTDSK
jgi:drug/metabolite transporter (DMT)-like permease